MLGAKNVKCKEKHKKTKVSKSSSVIMCFSCFLSIQIICDHVLKIFYKLHLF